jgi:hypothetical protein
MVHGGIVVSASLLTHVLLWVLAVSMLVMMKRTPLLEYMLKEPL